MSYITKQQEQIFKGERTKILVDKPLLAFVTDFEDEYFANQLHWKKVVIYFKHETSNQTKAAVLMNDQDFRWFRTSELARTGLWTPQKVQIFDRDGGYTIIEQAGIPNYQDAGVRTILKVAPFERILTFVDDRTFTIDSEKIGMYRPGYKLRVFDIGLDANHNDTVYTIESIIGNRIKLNYPINDYEGKVLAIKFPDFKNSNAYQRSMFQYIGKNFGDPVMPDAIVLPPGYVEEVPLPPIFGTWRKDSEDGYIMITFREDGTYTHEEEGEEDYPWYFNGSESGTYTWNNITGMMIATVLEDDNGEWGLSHPSETLHFRPRENGNELEVYEGNDMVGLFERYTPEEEEPT